MRATLSFRVEMLFQPVDATLRVYEVNDWKVHVPSLPHLHSFWG